MLTITSSSIFFRDSEMAHIQTVKPGRVTFISRKAPLYGNICRYQNRCASGGEESKTCFPALLASVTTIRTNRRSLEKIFPFVSSNGTVGATRLRLRRICGGDSQLHPRELLSSFIWEKEPTNNRRMRSSYSTKSELSAPIPFSFM